MTGLLLGVALAACGQGARVGPAPGAMTGGGAVTVVALTEVATAPAPRVSPRPPRTTATLPPSATVPPSPTMSPVVEAGATGSPVATEVPAAVASDEYAVLSAVLASGYAVRGQRALVLQDTTERPAMGAGQITDLEALYGPALTADFTARNDRAAPLAKQLSLPLTYHLVGRAELDGLLSDPTGLRYARRFPRSNGFVSVSRVGFDETGDLAMVAVGHTIAAGAGRGTLYVLARQGGRWSVVDAVPMWVR